MADQKAGKRVGGPFGRFVQVGKYDKATSSARFRNDVLGLEITEASDFDDFFYVATWIPKLENQHFLLCAPGPNEGMTANPIELVNFLLDRIGDMEGNAELYTQMQMRLSVMIIAGNGDSREAEAMREEMDKVWNRLPPYYNKRSGVETDG